MSTYQKVFCVLIFLLGTALMGIGTYIGVNYRSTSDWYGWLIFIGLAMVLIDMFIIFNDNGVRR